MLTKEEKRVPPAKLVKLEQLALITFPTVPSTPMATFKRKEFKMTTKLLPSGVKLINAPH